MPETSANEPYARISQLIKDMTLPFRVDRTVIPMAPPSGMTPNLISRPRSAFWYVLSNINRITSESSEKVVWAFVTKNENNNKAVNKADFMIAGITGEDTFDNQAWDYFKRVIDQAELLFSKRPQYESAILGLTKKYKESKIEVDKLTEFFSDKQKSKSSIPKETNSTKKKDENIVSKKAAKGGFCIRTGKSIPFNPKYPMCDEAYQSWSRYSKKDYPEKYCHYSGEPSNGETTYGKPILNKNWNKAKEEYNF